MNSIKLQKRYQSDAQKERKTALAAYNEKKNEQTKINVVIESRTKDLEYLKKEIESANEKLVLL